MTATRMLAALVMTSAGCPTSDPARDVATDLLADTSVDETTLDTASVDVEIEAEEGEPETFTPTESEGAAAESLAAESETPIEFGYEGGEPAFVGMSVPVAESLPNDPVFASLHFLWRYAAVYGLTAPAEQLFLRRVRVHGDDGGLAEAADVFFGQRHRGLEVFAAELGVHFAGGRIVFTNGHWLREIPALAPPTVTAEVATEVALDTISGNILRTLGAPRLVVFNLGLVRGESPGAHETVLAWRVGVRGIGGAGLGTSWQAFVDGATGEPIMTLEDTFGADASPLAIVSVGDTVSTDCWDNGWEPATRWFDATGATGDFPGAGDDGDGQRTYDSVRATYDFYATAHGRLGWAHADEPIEVIVDVGAPERASYSAGCRQIRFGDGQVALDLMAHEWAHAIDQHEADLIPSFQSGALAESLADVSAVRVDAGDLLIGEDLPGHAQGLRDLAHPTIDHLAEVIMPTGPPTDANDRGAVHALAGVASRAAIELLAGLGADKAGALLYAAWVRGLTGNATLRDARDVMLTLAGLFAHPPGGGEAVHGFGDPDVCAVKNAWAAVGVAVEEADLDCDGRADAAIGDDSDADGTDDDDDNCPGAANPSQANRDGDALGDACDDDIDGDGVVNDADPCPLVAGPCEPAAPEPTLDPDACARGGDACGPAWNDDLQLSARPGELVPIDGCPACPPWLPEGFTVAIRVSVANGEPVRVIDDRGRTLAVGARATTQTLTFRPGSAFWFEPAPGEVFRGRRFYMRLGGQAGDPPFDVSFSMSHTQ